MNLTVWTARDIPSLSGRTALVTGANSGLGYHTSLQLALHGASVVMAARDLTKGETAAAKIRAAARGSIVHVVELDLASLASVQRLASSFSASHDTLSILVNNAGVMAIPRRLTADGFEMQFGTNHLGHFALTSYLLPILLRGEGARVVTVSSTEGARGTMNFDDLQGERSYKPWGAYRQSKLANLLFMLELNRKLQACGVDIVSVAAHPGYAATNLQAVGPTMSGSRLQLLAMAIANRVLAQPASQGALPQLYAATVAGVRGGEYFGPNRLMHSRGNPVKVALPPKSQISADAARLWKISEDLTGARYDALDRQVQAADNTA